MPDEHRVKEIEGWFKDELPTLSIHRVSQLLSCSQRTVHRLISQNRLQSIKLSEGRSTKRIIPRQFLAEFIASCEA